MPGETIHRREREQSHEAIDEEHPATQAGRVAVKREYDAEAIDKLLDEIDELTEGESEGSTDEEIFAEIDELLEERPEVFVANFKQRGGE